MNRSVQTGVYILSVAGYNQLLDALNAAIDSTNHDKAVSDARDIAHQARYFPLDAPRC